MLGDASVIGSLSGYPLAIAMDASSKAQGKDVMPRDAITPADVPRAFDEPNYCCLGPTMPRGGSLTLANVRDQRSPSLASGAADTAATKSPAPHRSTWARR
jgi:hypothetical protein